MDHRRGEFLGACLTVGLTGGIASGKTTVSDCFLRLGVPVLDADVIAHELAQPGQTAFEEIIEYFGGLYLDERGCLHRGKLRQRILADEAARKRLEAILHPRIYAYMQHTTLELDTPYCIWSVPLLVETGQVQKVQRVLVVDCPEALQRERLMARTQLDEQQAAALLAIQCTREARLACADEVIHNDTDLATLEQQVAELHVKYLHWAKSRLPGKIVG